jgi:HEAT repeat protein
LRAVELLGALGLAECLPDIAPRLRDRDGDVRRAAVRAVGRISAPDAVPALLDVLDVPTRRVPEHCVTLALLRSGQTAVPHLVRTSAEGAPRARLASVQVLGWLGATEAVPVLCTLLAQGPVEIRVAAAQALGRIGSPAAAPALRGALGLGQPRLVRIASTQAIGRLGDPGCTDALGALLDEEHDLAFAAAVALGQLGAPGRKALTAVAPVVREAREVLGRPELLVHGGSGAAGGAGTGAR